MRVLLFFFGIIFLTNYLSMSAMQPPSQFHKATTIVKKMAMASGIETIACLVVPENKTDKISVALLTATGRSCVGSYIVTESIFLNVHSCSNYKPAKIDIHPYGNKFVINDRYCDVNIACCKYLDLSKDESANVFFSDRENLFFTVNNKSLACYHSGEQEDHKGTCFASEIPLGLLFDYSSGELPFGVISTSSSIKQSYFLCSDFGQKSMYKGTCGISSGCCWVFNTQKLFDFCEPLDLTHWVYSKQLDTFYSITQADRKLYVADIKTGKERIYIHDNDFKIGALILYPDQRILVLLSQKKDRISYVDSKTLQHLVTTAHEVSPADISNVLCGKIIACVPNDQLFLALDDQCLVIDPSSWIKEFNAYEKYREVIRQLDLPQELRWLVAQWFVCSVVSNKKGLS